MNEIWKDISNYEGLYQVSNLGRVRSLTLSKKIKSLSVNHKGYLITSLTKEKVKKIFRVHQLVAVEFLNSNKYSSEFVVDHIDFDKKNNKESNLRLITHSDNSSFRSNKKSIYKYITWDKTVNKWRAVFIFKGKKIRLKRYDDELLAKKSLDDFLATKSPSSQN